MIVAVLAGGRGRRLGGAKPVASLAGAPLIARPLAAASAAGLPAVVVAKPSTRLPPLDVPVWDEPEEPSHPLLGIVTALERAGGAVVAVGCDMPNVTAELLLRLATGPEGAVRHEGRLAPLPARYEPAWLPELRAALAAEAPLRATLEALGPAAFEVDDARVLDSINSPEQLAAAERA